MHTRENDSTFNFNAADTININTLTVNIFIPIFSFDIELNENI